MRKAGIRDYEAFAREILKAIPDRPISFEVFSDDFAEMEEQAHTIAGWGENVYVKIPVTNTQAQSSIPLISRLAADGVKVNVTAMMTVKQVRDVLEVLSDGPPACVSVFAGRIADTGRDPVPVMRQSLEIMAAHPAQRLIWASAREVLNVVQASQIGCHIITVTNDILAKLALLGKDHEDYSLETVEMFHRDAVTAGYTIAYGPSPAG
jgi:transaldolase